MSENQEAGGATRFAGLFISWSITAMAFWGLAGNRLTRLGRTLGRQRKRNRDGIAGLTGRREGRSPRRTVMTPLMVAMVMLRML